MRFLEQNSTGECSLTEELFGNDIPRFYAILSHTWEKDEVTFKDMIEATGRDKLGYKKIRFCAEQARRDGLRYFWVDTCCIDKSSSAELSEAINSMFLWYHNATICYAYLSDVFTNYNDDVGSLPSEMAFRKSRWFTRGWTIQELLAPDLVEFYSNDCIYIGNKASLEQQICEVTGIAATALQGTSLALFDVEVRFSWAKNRKTTRSEDRIYSLLGVFNIHMPLLYGEGENKAFRRLMDEINKAPLTDQSDAEFQSVQTIQQRPVKSLRSYRESLGQSQLNQIYQDLSMSHISEKNLDIRLSQKLEGHTSWVTGVAFSPDGKKLASASGDGTVRLWDGRSGATLQSLRGYPETIWCLAFSPDGETLAQGTTVQVPSHNGKPLAHLPLQLQLRGTIWLQDSQSGATLKKLEGHTHKIRGLAFSPDGKTLASASQDGTVRLWDSRSGATLQTLQGHTSAVYGVAFSTDGKKLASGSIEGPVWLWDCRSGAALQKLEGHTQYVYGVAFSPDGKKLASTSGDGTVRLWNSQSGAALQTLEGLTKPVYGVAFSPNSKTLASASEDATVRLWDSTSGAALQTLEGHTGPIFSVAFSPDGKKLASASMDHTVRLWT